MKIKAGEYVKLKRGEIFKIDENTTNYYNSNEEFITNEIVKHSKNIIDLIEVGDYVNGYKVRGKTNEKVVVDYYCYSQELCDGQWLSFQKDLIKSIVTKEMYFNAEYRVETN